MKNKHEPFENSAFLEMTSVIPKTQTNKKKVIMRKKPSTERLNNRQKTSYDLLRPNIFPIVCIVNNKGCQKLQFLFITFFTVDGTWRIVFFFARLSKTGKRRWLKITVYSYENIPRSREQAVTLFLVIHIRINDMNVTILFVCGTTAGDQITFICPFSKLFVSKSTF